MKSLKKNQLLELKAEMPMLDNKELLSVIGGDKYSFDYMGHYSPKEICSETIVTINGLCLTLSGKISIETWEKTYEEETENGIVSGTVSGLLIRGKGVNDMLFTFLACNTDVEWMFAFNSGSNGVLVTSHENHACAYGTSQVKGYSNLAHNHGNYGKEDWGKKPSFMTDQEWLEYNSLPSELDIAVLKENNAHLPKGDKQKTGMIYNKFSGEWVPYSEMTQEKYLAKLKKEKGIE